MQNGDQRLDASMKYTRNKYRTGDSGFTKKPMIKRFEMNEEIFRADEQGRKEQG